MSKSGSSHIILAGVAEEGSGAMTGKGMPQIRTLAVRMARIWFALFRPGTSALDIFQLGIAVGVVGTLLIWEDPLSVDHNVLHAADKGRRLMGEVAQIGLQVGYGSAKVGTRKRGLAVVGRLIRAHWEDGLLVIGRQYQMRGVDGDENFVPVAVVQLRANEDSLPLVQQRGVQVQSSIDQLQYVANRLVLLSRSSKGQHSVG